MRKLISSFLLTLLFATLACGQAERQTRAGNPKLVLLIAVDQFRYDFLTRFDGEFKGGIRQLLDKGANFVNANLEHYPTVTAIGHATMLSGATPATSGIIGNDWYDREAGKQVTSVSDDNTKQLGAGEGIGSSPRRFLVSTVGDELKRAGSPQSKVIGLSMKDRSAVLPAGHRANAAFWYDDDTGAFVSSTYYFSSLPDWAAKFNAARHAEKYAGKTWLPAEEGRAARAIPASPARRVTTAVYNSPYGNDLLEAFVEAAIDAEKLGQRGVTDLLSVSFSSNDAVGHSYGPDSPEVAVLTRNVDEAIGKLFAYIDKSVGMQNTIVMLTADHGVSPLPELLAEQNLPGGRIRGDFFAPLRTALETRYGPGKWLLSTAGTEPYFNYELMDERKLDRAEFERFAAATMAAQPHVARVYTRHQLTGDGNADDQIASRVFRSFNAKRSGDLEILLDPYWIRSTSGTTHGSPYNYDTHIPLILMGPGIKGGRYTSAVALNDLAPTLATLLDVEIPSGSVGRVLGELFEPAK